MLIEGFSVIFGDGEIPKSKLFLGKDYASSVVPEPPERVTDKDYFNKRVMEWLVK